MTGPVNRLRRHVVSRIGRWQRRPFPALVRHFLRRMLRPGEYTSPDDPEIGAGFVLGLLAAPGALASLLLLDKYSSFLSWFRGRLQDDLLLVSIPDKLLFLTLSMTITGVIISLRWDKLLPDAQDYAILAPLPVPPRLIFWANLAAILLNALLVAVVTNGASAILFPLFVAAAVPDGSLPVLPFLLTHAGSVFLASLFASLAVLAVLGVTTCLVPRKAWDATTGVVRGILITAWMALVPLTLSSTRLQPALPPAWFLAVYQQWQGRAPQHMNALADRAWIAMGLAAVICAVTYTMSYSRRFRSIPEGHGEPGAPRAERLFAALVRRTLPGATALDVALADFTVRGLWRSPTQRLAFAVPLAFGWLFVLNNPRGSLTAFLLPAMLFTLGLRAAMQIPASLRANGVFRLLLEGSTASARGAVRHVAILGALLLVVLPALVLGFMRAADAVAVTSAVLIGAGLAFLHSELVFLRAHRIPFTSPLPAFSEKLPVICILHVLAVVLGVAGAARLEVAARRQPWTALIPISAWVALRVWSDREHRLARSEGDPDLQLSFDAEDPGRVTLDSLTSAGPVNRP